MAQVPDDIKANIKALGEKHKIPIKSLLERLKEIVETDESIQAMEKVDFKIRFAFAKLHTEIASTGKTDDFYIQPTLVADAREITSKKSGEKMYVGDLTALVQKIEEAEDGTITTGDVELASGTFWREGAKSIMGLNPKKVYRASLISKKNPWGYEITTNRHTNFMEVEHKLPMTLKEFYEKEIKPLNKNITVGEMDLNKAENTTDIRVITVTAMDADVGERDGREFGYYDIADVTSMGEQKRFFVHPDDVIWNQGSVLNMIGTVEIDKETQEVRWNLYAVLPTELAEPRIITIKPVTGEKETVDINAPTPEEKEEETITKDDIETVKAEDIAPKEKSAESKKPVEKPKAEANSEEVDFEI